MTTLTFSPPETRLWKTFLNKHSRVSYDIKQKPVLTQQLHSSRQQLPQLKAWIGLSVQTWRSSRGPQAAIIRLAAADNCHQTKQDREILPLYPQLFFPPPFSHRPVHKTFASTPGADRVNVLSQASLWCDITLLKLCLNPKCWQQSPDIWRTNVTFYSWF